MKCFTILLMSLRVFAQEGDHADMMKMMEAYAKAATPGEAHQLLTAFEGDWTIKAKFRISADMPWAESDSKGTAHWMLGKRFMAMKVVSGPTPEMPDGFEGFGVFGYDNITEEYTLTWMDTMGTMTLLYRGHALEDGTGFSVSTTYTDIITKKERPSSWIYRIENEDTLVTEIHEADMQGNLFLAGVITYTRAQ
ncbi:MAG: DUF1579 family protein [Acidobacteria bacterium]|nr:DUF1579 family protein [Acidobacteriota bacterium]